MLIEMLTSLTFSYTKTGVRSNMAVAEVNALSGFKFDNEEMEKLTGISDLQRVELDNDDTKMNIYFNPVSVRHCFPKIWIFHFFAEKLSSCYTCGNI